MPSDLWLPKNLTDEELMLKRKYEILRQKKKAVLELSEAAKQAPSPKKESPIKLPPVDAKEHAKKMVLAGKITFSTKPKVEKTAFKRPSLLEKKFSSPTSTSAATKRSGEAVAAGGGATGFVSFTPKHNVWVGTSLEAGNVTPMMRGNGSEVPTGSVIASRLDNVPKRGPTIYVNVKGLGQPITEDMMRTVFGRFGRIAGIKLSTPTVAFVTFAMDAIAERAILEMNGAVTNGIEYEVSFARRQPQPFMRSSYHSNSVGGASSSNQSANNMRTWDYKRGQVVYEDEDDI